ncbi:hypothetical protein D187_005169 [Cystobacter fuscus DSM 2262]|uniref:Uncharacterized protein n=1 Tax=Cystobacter fuscus (strain ATCC 25194 / DSM 2262 / NBRC 100088 / M29) TaxID=1242864 RepID=S9PM09_CYSF2|nr:hypothetical protein D187_005169 [Cystobacter fuscus DSM 2262]
MENRSAFLHAAQVKTDQVETLTVLFAVKDEDKALVRFAEFIKRFEALRESRELPQ